LYWVFRQSQTFHVRPSQLVGLAAERASLEAELSPDAYTAYCFDEACFLWGQYVDGKISETRSQAKNKQQEEMAVRMLLERIFKDEEEVEQDEEAARPPSG
jgi:hypothetical protein